VTASRWWQGKVPRSDVTARVECDDVLTAKHGERLWRRQVGACVVGDVLPVRYERQNREMIVFTARNVPEGI
jgi:hypothetical protein